MPLSINVGLSRKASEDYQSSGVWINVTAELDQALLARPEELQQQIHQLYAHAQTALQRQAAVSPPRPPLRRPEYDDHPHQSGRYDRGESSRRTNGNGGSMTASQRRAILSIADRLRIDPHLEARDIVGVAFDDLSIRQASELIDHLKAIQSSGRRR